MSDESNYFEQAADALREAFTTTNLGEQAFLLDKALRLNRMAVAAERAKMLDRLSELPKGDIGGAASDDQI